MTREEKIEKAKIQTTRDLLDRLVDYGGRLQDNSYTNLEKIEIVDTITIIQEEIESRIEFKSIDERVYVVTEDGYMESYGSHIYLVGVFDNKSDADRYVTSKRVRVTEVEFNKEYPLSYANKEWFDEKSNSLFLGGYAE